MSCAWQQLNQPVNFPANSTAYSSGAGHSLGHSRASRGPSPYSDPASQEELVYLPESDQGDGSVDFEFPVEVERMVFELCNSSKDVLRDVVTTQPRQHLGTTPLGALPFECPGLDPGLALDLGLGLTGLNLNHADVPLGEPQTTPTKQRGLEPFSLQQVPIHGPIHGPISAPPPVDAASMPATLPYFATFPDHCVPADGGHLGGSYVRNTSGAFTSCGAQADLSDGSLSFRELVVKGCLELESILRGHKQYSYIGDLLSFCHAIREASSAASLEFDSPSEETRTLIIAFFRLVSCWLGLFPCQEELGQGMGSGQGAGHAFREWQQASRRVIVAILRRVPVLRERLQGDHAAPPWRTPCVSSTVSAVGRPPWPKTHAPGASRGAKQGSAKGGWSAGSGSEAGFRARKGSPRGLWPADDVTLDMEEGKGPYRQAGSPRSRDNWKTVFVQKHSVMDGFGSQGVADPRTNPPPALDGAFPVQPFSDTSPRNGRNAAAMARPSRPPASSGTRKWSGGQALRCALDLEDFHDGAYMKPGCYDVPMRRSAPPPVDGSVSSPAVNPAPPLLVSESTWQAAKASAETLCRALNAMHSPDDPSAPSASALATAALSPEQPEVAQGLATSGRLDDEVDVDPEAFCAAALAPATADSDTPGRCKGSVSDRESKGKRARQHARHGGGGGRSRSWTRSASSPSSQPLVQVVPRSQMSPASARRAKDILEVLWNLQEAEDMKFPPSAGVKGSPGCVSLDSMSRKLKRRAYESLEQFEQDFRRALFNHTKCSGESAKVCAQRTKSLEKAFDDLLQTHSQRASSPSSTATSASAATTGAADAAV